MAGQVINPEPHLSVLDLSLISFASRFGTSRASTALQFEFLQETEAARALTEVNESAKGRCLYALSPGLARETLHFFVFFFPELVAQHSY